MDVGRLRESASFVGVYLRNTHNNSHLCLVHGGPQAAEGSGRETRGIRRKESDLALRWPKREGTARGGFLEVVKYGLD
jgi:hypothetical protein